MRYAHCTLQSASRNARQKAYCAPPTTLARCEVLPQLAELLTSAGKREQLCDLIQAYCAPTSHLQLLRALKKYIPDLNVRSGQERDSGKVATARTPSLTFCTTIFFRASFRWFVVTTLY